MASDAELRSSLSVLSGATQISGAHAVSFQPSDTLENEDRYIVEDWTLENECWTFLGVFDGHGAGTEAVEFVRETLPGVIRDKLIDCLTGKKAISDSDIAELLVESIREIDERITNDFKTFFPGGPPELSGLSDDEIVKRISNSDTGASHAQVMRARTGTTALVAVIDPNRRVSIASLGDCDAILGTKSPNQGTVVKLVNTLHNCGNLVEVARVRMEHPNEPECIDQNRTLGLITLTRALGDTLFKLPPIYSERVIKLANPPLHPNYNIEQLIRLNISPPYLSNTAEVVHFHLADLAPNTRTILILCSDGLRDLYKKTSREAQDLDMILHPWISSIVSGSTDNLALDLLWSALGGNSDTNRYRLHTQGRSSRMDDTTVVVYTPPLT